MVYPKHRKRAPRRMRAPKQERNTARLVDVRCGDCPPAAAIIGTAPNMSAASVVYLNHLKDEHPDRWAELEADEAAEL